VNVFHNNLFRAFFIQCNYKSLAAYCQPAFPASAVQKPDGKAPAPEAFSTSFCLTSSAYESATVLSIHSSRCDRSSHDLAAG
jgi:hypothetical protein